MGRASLGAGQHGQTRLPSRVSWMTDTQVTDSVTQRSSGSQGAEPCRAGPRPLRAGREARVLIRNRKQSGEERPGVGRGQAPHPTAGPGAPGWGRDCRALESGQAGRPGKQGAAWAASSPGRGGAGGAVLPSPAVSASRGFLPDLRRQKEKLRPPRGRGLGSGSARCAGWGSVFPGQGPGHPGVCAGKDTQARRERLVCQKLGTSVFRTEETK